MPRAPSPVLGDTRTLLEDVILHWLADAPLTWRAA